MNCKLACDRKAGLLLKPHIVKGLSKTNSSARGKRSRAEVCLAERPVSAEPRAKRILANIVKYKIQ